MSLLKNSGWNILGTAISGVAMVLAMAYMARHLDLQSFGLLGLVLAVVGYASVLDGGFARAVVREIALLDADDARARQVLGTAIRIVALIGIAGAAMAWILAPWAVGLLDVNAAHTVDAVAGFRLTALMLPLVVLTMVWLAPLEGRHRFATLNQIRALGFSLMFGLSVAAVALTPSFLSAVCGLLLGRMLMALISWRASIRLLGGTAYEFDRESLQRLYQFGGWITVTNVVTPLLDYLDRFVLSIMGGASGIAYYAAPADAMQKMQALPGAVSRALFPMLSKQQRDKSAALLKRAILMQAIIGLAVACLFMVAGSEIVAAWLGEAYVTESTPVLQILAIGFLFNAMAWVPQTALQAQGFARQTALISLWQMAPYLFLLIGFTLLWGVIGAAVAWSVRAFMDLCLLGWCYRRMAVSVGVAL